MELSRFEFLCENDNELIVRLFCLEPEDKEAFIRMQLYDTSYQYFGPATWKWPESHNHPRDIPSIDDNIALDS